MNNSSDMCSAAMECGYSVHYAAIQAVVRLYLIAPLVCFGVCANLLNIAVFTHAQQRRQLVNWFLIGLAINDLLLLLLTFATFSLPVIVERVDTVWWHSLSARLTALCYPVAMTLQTLGVYLTVLVSVHRYLGVCHPFKMHRWGTAGPVKVAIGGAIGFALIFNTSRFFELRLCECMDMSGVTGLTIRANIQLFRLKQYTVGYRAFAYLLVMFALPFGVLIGVNSCIVRTLRRSGRHRRAMTQRRTSMAAAVKQKMAERKEHGTTIMLLAVVAMFLVCNSVAFVNNIVEILMGVFGVIGAGFGDTFTVLVELGNLLVTSNSAFTIFIYYSFGTKYRAVFWLVVRCNRVPDDSRTGSRRGLTLGERALTLATSVIDAGRTTTRAAAAPAATAADSAPMLAPAAVDSPTQADDLL